MKYYFQLFVSNAGYFFFFSSLAWFPISLFPLLKTISPTILAINSFFWLMISFQPPVKNPISLHRSIKKEKKKIFSQFETKLDRHAFIIQQPN